MVLNTRLSHKRSTYYYNTDVCKDPNDYRSSRPEVFCKKGILKNFAKFTGKQLCQSSFRLRHVTLFKKRHWHRCFRENSAKFFKNIFFHRTSTVSLVKYFSLNILQSKAFLKNYATYKKKTVIESFFSEVVDLACNLPKK